MSTKFKIFEGSTINVEHQLNWWMREEEPKGCMSIYDVHFDAYGTDRCMVLVHYSEWEPPKK